MASIFLRFSRAAVTAALTLSITAPAVRAFAQSAPSSGPVLEQRHPRYQLQRDDVIAISFPLSPELNQTVTVQPDGYISLQNAGSVLAQGLTSEDLVEAIKKAYAGILNHPIVNVDITDFQKPFFTVSGQVGKPGQYDLRNDLTVREALAVAGGLTMPSAKTQILLFRRLPNQSGYEVKRVNMKEILAGKDLNEDAELQPGDMVYVPQKAIANFKTYVPYAFNLGTYVNPLP